MEGWGFQREVEERLKIQDLYEVYPEVLIYLQARGYVLIPAGVDIGKYMSL